MHTTSVKQKWNCSEEWKYFVFLTRKMNVEQNNFVILNISLFSSLILYRIALRTFYFWNAKVQIFLIFFKMLSKLLPKSPQTFVYEEKDLKSWRTNIPCLMALVVTSFHPGILWRVSLKCFIKFDHMESVWNYHRTSSNAWAFGCPPLLLERVAICNLNVFCKAVFLSPACPHQELLASVHHTQKDAETLQRMRQKNPELRYACFLSC